MEPSHTRSSGEKPLRRGCKCPPPQPIVLAVLPCAARALRRWQHTPLCVRVGWAPIQRLLPASRTGGLCRSCWSSIQRSCLASKWHASMAHSCPSSSRSARAPTRSPHARAQLHSSWHCAPSTLAPSGYHHLTATCASSAAPSPACMSAEMRLLSRKPRPRPA